MTKNTVLRTQELSKYLKLNEKTILKMAQSGELPGFKIANQWRFYLSVVDEYLQDKIAKSSSCNFNELIRAGEVLPLSRLVERAYIIMDLKADGRDDVLHELANVAYDSGIADSAEVLFKRLQKRETMLSTAVGNGVAIPHPRNPSDELFKRPGVIIARSVKGIDYSPPDQKKVHLFFMVCAPDVVLHLKLLSKIAKLFKSKDVFEKFLNADSKDKIMKVLLENERFDIGTVA